MYVHRIDPIIGSVFGVHTWWYGLSYTLGFTEAFLYLRRRLPPRSLYNLCMLMFAGVLLGGRVVEVVFYEWPFYSAHPQLIPAVWLGGMATHGLLFGGLLGVWLFCLVEHRPFLVTTDMLAIPAAFILGVGRIGNFIDGQIVGSITSVPWAVKFPDAAGFRHPVVLYDGLKNLLIIPILILVAKRKPRPGVLTGTFLFLYAFLRIFVDLFREYPTTLLGLATGQVLNIVLSIVGLVLLFVHVKPAVGAHGVRPPPAVWQRIVLVFLLIFPLIIPSDWTQDVPARYGKRHAGLVHTAMYPPIP
ncbi:MAG TPA: prolipoprotein diacylglyceryl transferase [Thermoanaerobaculia bacterium]|nr:prolipoprotein diacylglyceryl transferase [Thermoanaerobaculia bacterium]